MDKLIAEILEIKGLTACPYVSFFVPVALEQSVHTGDQQIVANIKFSIIIEKGPVYVWLDDVCEGISIRVFLFSHALLDLAEGRQLDGVPSVSILPWLDDPNFIGVWSILFKESLELLAFPRVNMISFGYKLERVLAGNVLIVMV